MLGYPSNILGYPSKYRNYTSKKLFGRFPQVPPCWITFLPFISQIFLLHIKDVEVDFIMGCILVLFPFLSIINVQFTNFWFFNFQFFYFQYSDIGLLCSKITIFIIEITLKLLLNKKYGWNCGTCHMAYILILYIFLPSLIINFSSHFINHILAFFL